MVTGDAHINAGAPVVCCTAEILANQALREGEGADVGCVAMDEFHYYGDYDRGWAWQVPLLTLPKTQFLLMSATLGDVDLHCPASLKERTGTDGGRRSPTRRGRCPWPTTTWRCRWKARWNWRCARARHRSTWCISRRTRRSPRRRRSRSYGVASKEQREAR